MPQTAFWLVQGPGWLLVAYLAVAQCLAAFSYALGVRMGTQEPAERTTGVGVALFRGFAGADLVVYTPLLAAGLLGHAQSVAWSGPVLGAALGITVYWPVMCLWTVRAARGAPGWDLSKERHYWAVLPVIAAWGALALIVLATGG